MSWIFEGLIEVFLSLAAEIIEFCMNVFADFDLDVGYSQSASWSELFSPVYYEHAEGLLDSVFPSAQYFLTIFMYIGYALVFIIMGFKLFQSMLGPLSDAEHPVKIAALSLIACVGVTYSYTFFIIAERGANYFYGLFKAQFITLQGVGLPNIKSFVSSPQDLFQSGTAEGISGLGLALIALVLFIALIVQFARLMLEMFERYVMLGVLFYTCPLAFSTLASESTRKIFSSWMQMLISQFILMLMNLFFLGMFYAGFIVVFAPADATFMGLLTNAGGTILETLSFGMLDSSRDYVFSGPGDFLCKMFILIGWLTVGQKVDEHLRALGLSVSTSGHGLGAALAAGAYGAMKVVKAGAGMIKSGGRMADRINRGRQTAEKNDAMTGKRQAAYDSFTRKPVNDKGTLGKNMSAEGYKKNLSRNPDGTLTKQGACTAVNAPKTADGKPIEFGSKDAKTAMENLNLHPDKEGPCGEVPARHSLSDGKFTSYDASGSPVREVGDSERYKADGAEISYSTPMGRFVEPATQDHINSGVEAMGRSLAAKFDGEDVSWEAGRNAEGKYDGTMTGKDSLGRPVYQAALDQVASMNPERGGVAKAGNESLEGVELGESNMSYSVQNLNDPICNTKFTPGYDSIAPAATQLTAKSVSEQNESYVASKGAEGLSRFMRAEEAARSAVSDPYPVEDRYTKAGRVINRAEESARSFARTSPESTAGYSSGERQQGKAGFTKEKRPESGFSSSETRKAPSSENLRSKVRNLFKKNK